MIDNSIVRKLQKEHPEIYLKYLKDIYNQQWYTYIYDDKKVLYNGVEMENERYQENPEEMFNIVVLGKRVQSENNPIISENIIILPAIEGI